MTPDEIERALARIFPGDPVPDVQDDDGVCWVQRETTGRGPRLAAYTPPPQVESPRIKPEFQRLMTRESHTPGLSSERLSQPPQPPQPVVTVPARAYLLESAANVTRWLEEARDIASDVRLGQAVEPHRVTRLMLEAIPVVEKFTP